MKLRRVWVRGALAALVCVMAAACEAEPMCPGAEGCACQSAAACGDDLVCSQGSCARPREIGVAVDGAARACEVLVLDGDAEVADVAYGDAARGAHVREAPRTALSFTSRDDASLGADSVRLRVVGSGEVRLGRTRCFDSDGRLLADAHVRLDG